MRCTCGRQGLLNPAFSLLMSERILCAKVRVLKRQTRKLSSKYRGRMRQFVPLAVWLIQTPFALEIFRQGRVWLSDHSGSICT
jgi:hypothetical protein